MKVFFCVVVIALAADFAHAATIDFDSYPNNTVITNQYPQAVFSSEPGYFMRTFAYGGADPHSAPNVLGAASNFGPANLRNLYVDFTSPVSGLTFQAVAANEYGTIARVLIYSGVNNLIGTENIIGNAPFPNTTGLGGFLVNLTAYPNITRIEVVPPIGMTEIDGNQSPSGGGLIYDDFMWESVPEPTTLGLLALAGLLIPRRGRR